MAASQRFIMQILEVSSSGNWDFWKCFPLATKTFINCRNYQRLTKRVWSVYWWRLWFEAKKQALQETWRKVNISYRISWKKEHTGGFYLVNWLMDFSWNPVDFSGKSSFLPIGKICPIYFKIHYWQNPHWLGLTKGLAQAKSPVFWWAKGLA